MASHGNVAEWLKAPVSKTGNEETRPRVQIPPFPQNNEIDTDVSIDYVLREEEGFEPSRDKVRRRSRGPRRVGVERVRDFVSASETKYPRE